MMPMTGVAVDESLTSNDEKKPDAFEAALKAHGVPDDLEDFSDLPQKTEAAEKLPRFGKPDPSTGELGDSAFSRVYDEAEFKQQVAQGLVEAEAEIDDLERHYEDLGGNLSTTLSLYCDLVDLIEQDNVHGFGRAVELTSGGKWRTLRADSAKAEAPLEIDPRTGAPFPTASLDRRVSKTQDAVARGNHKVDTALAHRVMKATGAKTFADAIRMVKVFNRDLLDDNWKALAHIAHAKGAPVTPRQLQAWQHNEGVKAQQQQELAFSHQQISAFATARDYSGRPLYPRFEALKTPMAGFLQSGMANSLQEAYALADQAYSAPAIPVQPEDYATQVQISNFATERDRAGQLRHPRFEQLRTVMSSYLQSGMVDTLEQAYEVAAKTYKDLAYYQQPDAAPSSTDRLAKAKNAMPVKSSGSYISSSSSDARGLDGHLSAALDKYYG
jgi:hypothetical protein